jgi:hypothetical protein
MLSLSLTLSLPLLYAGHQNANVSWRAYLRYVSQCRSRNATGRFQLQPSEVQLIITLFKSGVTHDIPFHLFPSCRPHHQLVPPPHATRYVCKSRSVCVYALRARKGDVCWGWRLMNCRIEKDTQFEKGHTRVHSSTTPRVWSWLDAGTFVVAQPHVHPCYWLRYVHAKPIHTFIRMHSHTKLDSAGPLTTCTRHAPDSSGRQCCLHLPHASRYECKSVCVCVFVCVFVCVCVCV